MSEIERYLNALKELNNKEYSEFIVWFLDNAKPYEAKVEDISQFAYMMRRARARECYRTSLIAASSHDELEYVEGYYITDSISMPFEHGFNIDADGNLLDLTALNNKVKVKEYYGVVIPKDYILEFVNSKYNGATSYMKWYYYNHIKKK